MNFITRRAALWQLGTSTLALAAAACSSAAPATAPTPAAKAAPLTIALANSELVVGPNRIALGLIGPDNQPIADAEAIIGFYQLEGTSGTKRGEAPAVYRWVEYRQRGVYAARTQFDAPGQWGLEVTALPPGATEPLSARATVTVKDHISSPMIGDPARASHTLTAGEVPDLAQICSNTPPCSLHTQSLDTALQSGRPVVAAFATPGFCTSLSCAPQLSVVLGLVPRYAGRVEFVHVEIYKEPRDHVVADAVTEWQLPSEPWTYVINKGGNISDRYEGVATADELTESLEAIV